MWKITAMDKEDLRKHVIYRFDIVEFLSKIGCLPFIGMLFAMIVFGGAFFLFLYLANH